MSRDFGAEFKKRLRQLDHIEEPVTPTPILIATRRYNVHKRSLPVAIDKIIVFSVTKIEAEWWVDRKLKSKAYHNDVDDTKTIIYYDIVPVDATPKEKSVFFNKSPVTTEEILGYKAPERIN